MQQKSSEPSHYPKDEIDLRDLFSLLFASKHLIFIVTLLFTIAASVYAFSIKPTYKVTTLINNAQSEVSRLSCTVKLCIAVRPTREPVNIRTVLIKEIEKTFADSFNNLVENKALITNLNLSGIHNIEFTTEAISKEVAIKQASELVTYAQNANEKLINIIKGQTINKLTWTNAGLRKINKNIDLINYNIGNIEKKIEIIEKKIEIEKSRREISYLKYKSELRKPKLGAYYDSNFLLNDISIWLIRDLPNIPDEQIDKVQNLEDAFALINKYITDIGLDKVYRDSLIKSLDDTRKAYIQANKYDDSLIPIEFDLNENSSAPTSNLSSSDKSVALTDDFLGHNSALITLNNELITLNTAKNSMLHKLSTNTEITTYNAMLKMQKLDFEFLLLDTSYYNSEIIEQSVSGKSTTKYPKPLLIIFGFLSGLLSASFFILSKSALTNYLNSNKK